MSVIQPILHYSLHFIFPFVIAWIFYREKWLKASLMMVSTMLVDLDHLLADPIFDPNRCSINYHFLHTYWAIGFYTILLFFPKAKIITIGLLLHMATDFQDCLWINLG
jgi:hypothetical protein